MKNSRLLDFLFGYESAEESFLKSGAHRQLKRFKDNLISGVGKGYERHIANNPIVRFFSALSRAFSYTSVRSYSLMFLTFGILTLLLNLGSSYFTSAVSEPFPLIFGAAFVVIAIPLFIFDIPLCDALCKLEITDYIVYELFCLKRVKSPEGKGARINFVAAIFLGALIAIIGFFLPLNIVLLVIGCGMFLFLSISSPEFCFMATLLFLPTVPLFNHSSIVLCCITLINVASFFLKVLFGKRLYHFEMYDLVLILFFLFVLVSGIFNGGLNSFGECVIFIALGSSYFLASNLIVNRRLADNAVHIIFFASVPTAIYAVIDYFAFPDIHPEWIDGAFADQIKARAEATFANPNVYAVYLIVVIVFSLVYAFDSKPRHSKFLYLSVFAVNALAMLLTWTRGAWIALFLAFIAYAVLRARSAPKLLLIPAVLIPLGLAFIPSAFVNRLLSVFNLSDSSIASRLSVWRSSIRMFCDNIFLGIGIGEESFASRFLEYAEDGVTAPHSHNLLLEIGIEAGIFALILFIFLLLIRVRHLASYERVIKTTSLYALTMASATAVFSLVAFGMTDYILFSPVTCYLFFTVFGLCSATLRIARREHDEDIGFTSDFRSSESASLNISLDV